MYESPFVFKVINFKILTFLTGTSFVFLVNWTWWAKKSRYSMAVHKLCTSASGSATEQHWNVCMDLRLKEKHNSQNTNCMWTSIYFTLNSNKGAYILLFATWMYDGCNLLSRRMYANFQNFIQTATDNKIETRMNDWCISSSKRTFSSHPADSIHPNMHPASINTTTHPMHAFKSFEVSKVLLS